MHKATLHRSPPWQASSPWIVIALLNPPTVSKPFYMQRAWTTQTLPGIAQKLCKLFATEGRVHLAGFGTGAVSGFHAAMANPALYQSLLTMNGHPTDGHGGSLLPTDSQLQRCASALNELPIFMFGSCEDEALCKRLVKTHMALIGARGRREAAACLELFPSNRHRSGAPDIPSDVMNTTLECMRRDLRVEPSSQGRVYAGEYLGHSYAFFLHNHFTSCCHCCLLSGHSYTDASVPEVLQHGTLPLAPKLHRNSSTADLGPPADPFQAIEPPAPLPTPYLEVTAPRATLEQKVLIISTPVQEYRLEPPHAEPPCRESRLGQSTTDHLQLARALLANRGVLRSRQERTVITVSSRPPLPESRTEVSAARGSLDVSLRARCL